MTSPTKIDSATVDFFAPAKVRSQAKAGILEDRILHKLFLITHIPAAWNPPKIFFGLLVTAVLVWLIWSPLEAGAVVAAGIYMGFALLDWALLVWLPSSGRSFGPVGSQLFIKSAPRVGVIVIGAFLAWLLDSVPLGLIILFILQLFGSAAYTWGMFYEPFALKITYKTIHAPGWTPTSAPLRLLHLSDLHVERLTRREDRLLALIDQARPDLIVITGDYLNLSYVNDPTAQAEVRGLLAKLSAPYGVYATLGSPPVDQRHTTPSLFDDLNIRLLRDEVAVIRLGNGQCLSLIGVDCEHDLESDVSALHNLLEVAPNASAHVLLYHSPELMPIVQQSPIDLYLCGHTHGGQIRLPGYGAIITSSVTGKRYEMGAYTEGNTTLYVSRGIGLEGLSAPRMRLFCPPEITLFTLSGHGEGA